MLCIWPNGNEWRLGQVSGVDGKNDLPNYPSNGWGDDYTDRTTGLPNLTDPATLGCMLALVRDAYRDAYMVVYYAEFAEVGWIVADCEGYEVCRGTSERVVLVSALEAAE